LCIRMDYPIRCAKCLTGSKRKTKLFFVGLLLMSRAAGAASSFGVLRKVSSDFFKQTPPKSVGTIAACLFTIETAKKQGKTGLFTGLAEGCIFQPDPPKRGET